MIQLKTKLEEELKRQQEIYERSLPHSCVRVINAEDTADEKPDNETSWREYWENRTGKNLDDLLKKKGKKYLCPCYKHHDKDDGYVEMKDICGCHVQEATENGDIKNKTMYIVPMCRGCNKRNDTFRIPSKYLVKLR